MIALLDYGSGNLRSVERALKKAGAEVELVRRPDQLPQARGVVLPGVGAFDDCLGAMQKQDLLGGIREFIASGRPFLGICVGYQALFERSEEFNSCASGLEIFSGKVVRFGSPTREASGKAFSLKVPQIGWNQLEITRTDCPLYKGVATGSYVYFVHSFYPVPANSSIVATWTEYGERFASSVWQDNVFATQFHPEKSQQVGLKLLSNFIQLCG